MKTRIFLILFLSVSAISALTARYCNIDSHITSKAIATINHFVDVDTHDTIPCVRYDAQAVCIGVGMVLGLNKDNTFCLDVKGTMPFVTINSKSPAHFDASEFSIGFQYLLSEN